MTPLYLSIKKNHYEIFKVLLSQKSIKVNLINTIGEEKINLIFHQTALYLAVKEKKVEMVRLLLSHNEIDINIICVF